MRRLHDRFGSTKRQNRRTSSGRPVDDGQRSSYAVAVDSTTGLKHTSIITDDAVCIVALLNMEIFQAAACLTDKNFGDRSATVEGHNVETEVLLVKLKGI